MTKDKAKEKLDELIFNKDKWHWKIVEHGLCAYLSEVYHDDTGMRMKWAEDNYPNLYNACDLLGGNLKSLYYWPTFPRVDYLQALSPRLETLILLRDWNRMQAEDVILVIETILGSPNYIQEINEYGICPIFIEVSEDKSIEFAERPSNKTVMENAFPGFELICSKHGANLDKAFFWDLDIYGSEYDKENPRIKVLEEMLLIAKNELKYEVEI